DAASKGRLSALLKHGDLDKTPGSTLLLYDLPGTAAQRVLVVSLGPRESFGDKAFREALGGVAKYINRSKAAAAAVAIVDVDADVGVAERPPASRIQEASRALVDGLYRFDAPTADDPPDAKRRERHFLLVTAA